MLYKILSAESVEKLWREATCVVLGCFFFLHLPVQSVPGSHRRGWHPAGAGSASRKPTNVVHFWFSILIFVPWRHDILFQIAKTNPAIKNKFKVCLTKKKTVKYNPIQSHSLLLRSLRAVDLILMVWDVRPKFAQIFACVSGERAAPLCDEAQSYLFCFNEALERRLHLHNICQQYFTVAWVHSLHF